jgi:hypothetical protein
MSIFDKLRTPTVAGLLKEQHLMELVTRREFRCTEEYVRREVTPRLADDEIHCLDIAFRDGYGELTCQVKKRLLPAIPFSARFMVERVACTPWEKRVYLRLEEVKPLDFDWLTRRMVERLPFLSYADGAVVCDLMRIPRLAELFDYRVRGVRVSDFLTIKDLAVRPGLIVGRLGVVL